MNVETVNSEKKNGNGFVKFLYVVSAVLAVIFVYMMIVSIMYIRSYAVSYGMAFSDMWQEAVQHIVTESVSYFVYAVLVFSAGAILSKVQTNCCTSQAQEEESVRGEEIEDAEEVSADIVETAQEEGFDPDKVINRLNKNEEAEEAEEQLETEIEEVPDEKPEPVKQRRKRRYMK